MPRSAVEGPHSNNQPFWHLSSMVFKSSTLMGLAISVVCLLPTAAFAECVILLHGLARTKSSMEKLEEQLTESGYHAVNLGYPSREYSIEELANLAIEPALKECPPDTPINFVTHSLGGILVRQYLSENDLPGLHHVIMLGPPNQGSEVVDKLGNVLGFHYLNGDAGMELGTEDTSVPNSLGAADFSLGVVAGKRSINLILSMFIPGKDDGKVSIEHTKVDGMDDHIIMPATHPYLMKNKKVIHQVLYFLENGEFDHVLKESNSRSESDTDV